MRGAAAAAIAALAACASPPTLIGRPGPPLAPAQVRLYLEPPAVPYESIAILRATSADAFAFTAEGKAQAVIRRLESQAASLGADGLLLEEISDDPDATTLAGGVGTRYPGARGNIDLGISGALTARKYGRGTAIRLTPTAAAPPPAVPRDGAAAPRER